MAVIFTIRFRLAMASAFYIPFWQSEENIFFLFFMIHTAQNSVSGKNQHNWLCPGIFSSGAGQHASFFSDHEDIRLWGLMLSAVHRSLAFQRGVKNEAGIGVPEKSVTKREKQACSLGPLLHTPALSACVSPDFPLLPRLAQMGL